MLHSNPQHTFTKSQLAVDPACTTPSPRITQNNKDSDASSPNTMRTNLSHWPHVRRLSPPASMRAQITDACHRENHHIAIPAHSNKKKESAAQRNFKAFLFSQHLLNIKRWTEKYKSTKINNTPMALTRKNPLSQVARETPHATCTNVRLPRQTWPHIAVDGYLVECLPIYQPT